MKASDKQVGGNHYKDFPIQPTEFITKNDLTFLQGNIIKRICRYNKREYEKGVEDLEKIKHEVDLIIEWEGWGEEKHFTPGLPKLHLCRCGGTPFVNWGNGFYWAECPACHNVGSKAQLQYGAQTHWNEGEWDGKGI